MELIIASRNPHKWMEIRQIVDFPSIVWQDAKLLKNMPEVQEDGATFAANAIKKAMLTALYCKCWALADDSGLEVAALNGAPGVHSARYAGTPTDYAANNAKLLRELGGKNDRSARFCCVIALASPKGRAQIVEGYCAGKIIETPRGQNGFGYDPLFVPDGYAQTFAEMDAALKNRISHRARALQEARMRWTAIFAGNDSDWPARI